MILHLLFDEKFSNYVIQQFNYDGMESDFVLVSTTHKMKYFKYLQNVTIINPSVESEMSNLLLIIKMYNTVIFHGLFHPWQEMLLKNWPHGTKIAWVCWGGEIYGQSDISNSFLKPLTKCAFYIHKIRHYKKNKPYIFPKDLLYKVDFCLTGIMAEYEYIRNYLGTNINHLRYSYSSIDDTIGTLKHKCRHGHDILIGNSATIENNHLDILFQLKKIEIGNRKIILPLSYGKSWVRNMCMKVGKLLFKKNFKPLLDFIPREEYNSVMLGCAVMIQPHLREQAHANIVTGLWLGLRIYLSEKGIDYKHFKEIGCNVYSIEKDLNSNNTNILLPLSDEEVEYNRSILLRLYGKENVQRNIQRILQKLN